MKLWGWPHGTRFIEAPNGYEIYGDDRIMVCDCADSEPHIHRSDVEKHERRQLTGQHPAAVVPAFDH